MKARAVQKAAKKADQLHAQIYGNKDAAPVDNPDDILDELNAEVDAPVKEMVNESGTENDAPVVTSSDDAATDDSTPTEGAAEPVQEPVETIEQQLAKSEHRYKVLQGMHRKLLEDNNQLRARVETLEATPPKIQVSPLESSEALITDSDVDDYGTDLIEFVKRAAKAEISPQLAKLEQENEQLRNQITGVTTTIDSRAKDDVYGTLGKNVPGWEQINQSEDFLFWLAQKDAFSGQRRHDLLTQAFKNNDSARVVAFFNAFLSEDMTVTPPMPAAPSAPVVPKVDLRSMVAPGRAQSAGQPNNQTESRLYSRDEISAHYKAVQLGKFTGTAADKLRIEKAFVKAANEGRVR